MILSRLAIAWIVVWTFLVVVSVASGWTVSP
jgi:hypothetical protein